MQRTYELALVLDPRLSEEEARGVVDEYSQMITSSGAHITKEESWGKRKLAYPIEKLTEGIYTFLYIVTEETLPVRNLETRLSQNEKVLRFLTVRTDEDLKRALRKGRKHIPAAEAVGLAAPRDGGADETQDSGDEDKED